MTNTPFSKPSVLFMISRFYNSSTLQQQAIHLVFGTDEGMVREKASGIFAALTEGTNEFSHEILEAACGDSAEAAQLVRQVMEALRLPFFRGAVVWMRTRTFWHSSGVPPPRKRLWILSGNCWKAAWGRTSCFLFPPLTNATPCSFNVNTPHREELNKPDITKAGWEGSFNALINKETAARGMILTRRPGIVHSPRQRILPPNHF